MGRLGLYVMERTQIQPDAQSLFDAEPGDRITVEYASKYADLGTIQTVSGEIVEVDVNEWPATEGAVSVTIDFHHDGDDARQDHYDTERTRRYEATWVDGELVMSNLDSRNGYRWNTISQAHPDPVAEVE